MAETLTSKQRSYLRSQAHTLKPLVHVGKDGVTGATVKTVEDAFNNRELLKVKVLDGAPEDARASAETLAAKVDEAVVVQVMGRIVTLYRPHPDKPQLKLPR